ncbi:AraC family transcriptional regulator [Ruegeria arenilitoris]|uniref:AraC family transcriptional regulator n=1 Tax=Ruegeria arenilitoris TaxID=1173585 RepID=UPI00147FF449|nr:AraC family transcriptional regulator [Ruegeria arenilitoris]
MELQRLLDDAKALITEAQLDDGFWPCGVRDMVLAQTRQSKRPSCSVVEPMIGLVLQGSKSVQYGTEHVRYDAGDVIVVGSALPMVSGLVDASPEHPYIALYIGIDMRVLRGVYTDMGGTSLDDAGPALESGQADAEVIDSFTRLFRMRRDPIADQTLGAAAVREVYFRVLRSDKGRALRRIIRADSKANQVAKAIAHIRKEYRSTIKASDLAAISGMSASVFYDAFKRVTANSPLQFQKDLRLTEAFQLLQQTGTPVSSVAHAVGYESPAQFSREFAKKFGVPPRELARDHVT